MGGGKFMKRVILFSITVVFAMASAAVYAAERTPLGKGNFALKLDYIVFTDSHFDRGGNQNDGLYVGLEGYGEILPNLYLGGEIGTATNVEMAGEEISFHPLELNLKYAIEAAPKLVIDFGGGVSYSYVELQYQVPFGRLQQERDDWLFGAQFFIDLTYKINWFSVGLNAKYQVTEDFRDEGLDLNNFRVGFKIGIMF
jgi:hypothetical protein